MKFQKSALFILFLSVFVLSASSVCKPDYSNHKLINDVIRFDAINSSNLDWDNWKLISKNSGINTESNEVVVFHDKVYVVGQPTTENYKEKYVWSSSDGSNWNFESKINIGKINEYDVRVKNTANSLFVFNDKLVDISYNGDDEKRFTSDYQLASPIQIWTSTDGKNWVFQKNDLTRKDDVRSMFQFVPSFVVFKVNGKEELLFFDRDGPDAMRVFSTNNLFNWKEKNPISDYWELKNYFIPRVFNNKIFITSQEAQFVRGYSKFFLYSSSDGEKWTKIEPKTFTGKNFLLGYNRNTFVYNNKLYHFGFPEEEYDLGKWKINNSYDLFSSSDGINWIREQHKFNANFIGSNIIMQFNNSLLMFRGTRPTRKLRSEVWKLDFNYLVKVSSLGFPKNAFTVFETGTGNTRITGQFYLNALGNNNFDKTFSLKETPAKLDFQVAEYNHAVYPKTNYGNGDKVDLIQMSTNPVNGLFSYALTGYAGNYCSFGSKTPGVFDYPSTDSCSVKLKLNDQTLEKTVKPDYSFDDLANLTYADKYTRCFKIKVS